MKRSWWWLPGVMGVVMLLAACGEAADKSSPGRSESASEQQAITAGAPSSAAAPATNGNDAAPAAGAVQQSSNAPAAELDRKIISTRFLDLTVKDVRGSFDRVGAIATAFGGFVTDANLRAEGKESRASITVRVPAARQQEVVEQIDGLASSVDGARASANDVTEEYVDSQSRIRNLQATEAQLLVFLGQAKNVQEVLQVQDRLNAVRAEIEKAQGRLNALGRLTELATIQVQLKPEAPGVAAPKSATGPMAALRRGWDASTEVVGGLALASLTVVAFSWWLAPLIALALWLLRRDGRRRAATVAAPPPTGPTAA